jgi:hypothetical protein
MATLMTNLTTATFVASNNQLLLEFGVAINIMALFFVHYCDSYFHSYIPPKERHIEHFDRDYVKALWDGF